MSWHRFLARIHAWFRPPEDLAEEMRCHLALEEQERRKAGLTDEEARFQARRRAGNRTLALEDSRAMWTAPFLESLAGDLQYALRQLRRAPVFAATCILTLAIGIGGTTAAFSIVNTMLLQGPPFPSSNQLVQFFETEQAPGQYPVNSANFLDWQRESRTMVVMALYGWGEAASVSGSGEPEKATVTRTQATFFDVLRVKPFLGRTFAPGDDIGPGRVAILSYSFWQRHFGASSNVLSQKIRMNGDSYSVIGVMPSVFRFPAGVDIWRPLNMTDPALRGRSDHNTAAIGRIKEGYTLGQARAELLGISKRLEAEYPFFNKGTHAVLVPLPQRLVGDSKPLLLILLGAVSLVLLVACANIANLLLARAVSRGREMAVRTTLGAGRLRLTRQLLTESLLLATIGCALGVGLASLCVRLLDASASVPIPHESPIGLDSHVLLFTIAISLLAAIFFGLAPASLLRESKLNDALKSGSQSVVGTGNHLLFRKALIAGELALTLALLMGAALLLRSYTKLRTSTVGIDSQNLFTATINLPQTGYPGAPERRVFFDQLQQRLQLIQGVRTVAFSSELPTEGHNYGYIQVDPTSGHEKAIQLIGFNSVSPEYFAALRIPVLRGRAFTQQDVDEATPIAEQLKKLFEGVSKPPSIPTGLVLKTVISQMAARRFWPRGDAIGKTFSWVGIPVTVVGIVADVKENSVRDAITPQAYLSFADKLVWSNTGVLSVKTDVTPGFIVPALRSELRKLDSNLALFQPRTMEEVLANGAGDTKFQTVVLGSFAIFTLLLAAIGLYGVMSYLVTQQMREIGVRMALGAERADIYRLIVRQGLTFTCAGLLGGTALALAMTRTIKSLLYGVQPFDLRTFCSVVLMLLAVTVLAFFLPARRATRIQPTTALRYG